MDHYWPVGDESTSMMVWTLRYFAEPTPYFDEPNEFITPGYYIVAHHVDDELEAARTVFKLEESVDEDGIDNREAIAAYVVAILNAAPDLVT